MPLFLHDHDSRRAKDVDLVDLSDHSTKKKIESLMEACLRADGHPPFGDHELLAIASGTSQGHLGFGVSRDDGLAGYGHLSALGSDWLCEIAVHPSERCKGVASRILDAITAHVAAHGGGSLSTWSYHAHGATEGLLRHGGFQKVRALYHMRCADLPDEAPPVPQDFRLDHFVPGRDDDDWLKINAEAFADLPDQGSWTKEDLHTRLVAPWFRPEDFLLLRQAEAIAGFCWCKLDPTARTHRDEQMGEIYVIAVARAYREHHLGSLLVRSGLHHLRERGADVGMLYVDASNASALRMYEQLGFVINHEDVCLQVRIAAD